MSASSGDTLRGCGPASLVHAWREAGAKVRHGGTRGARPRRLPTHAQPQKGLPLTTIPGIGPAGANTLATSTEDTPRREGDRASAHGGLGTQHARGRKPRGRPAQEAPPTRGKDRPLGPGFACSVWGCLRGSRPCGCGLCRSTARKTTAEARPAGTARSGARSSTALSPTRPLTLWSRGKPSAAFRAPQDRPQRAGCPRSTRGLPSRLCEPSPRAESASAVMSEDAGR